MQTKGLFGLSPAAPCQNLAANILAWDFAAASLPTNLRENELVGSGQLGLAKYLASNQAASKRYGRAKILVRPTLA